MGLQTVRQTINKYRLLDKGDKVLVAVSGGADSLTLLYILNALSKELELTLHVAHLDHMLRPDSGLDRVFVEKFAARLNIPVTTHAIDVKHLARKGSIEEIAREARLDFLCRIAKEIKADKIALGHTRDDQAETVLMHIIRGSGLYGLGGIIPKRRLNGFEVIRPLIEVSRWEIESFLGTKRIRARLDSSNLEDVYFRNRVRNKLMPLLRKSYNSNIAQVLANMAQGVACDYEYLYKASHNALRRLLKKSSGDKVSLDLRKFLKLHPSIQRIVLRSSVSQLQGSTRRLTFQHIREIEDMIYNRPVNSIVDLPKGICVTKKKLCLTVSIREK